MFHHGHHYEQDVIERKDHCVDLDDDSPQKLDGNKNHNCPGQEAGPTIQWDSWIVTNRLKAM